MKRFKYLPSDPNRLLMLLLGLWFVLNILQGIFTELANDEAYYWFITGELSMGYFDHPPLFGLLTWLGVSVFGDSEIGVRFFTIALQPLYLYLFWTVVRTQRSTWRSALVYFFVAFSIPQLQLYGWVVTPDAPLLAATALLLWSFHNFSKTQSILYAAILGLSIALLAYAKYQGALLVLLLVLSDLRLLRQWKFWAAGALAVLLIVPHLMWQAEHDWVSFRYHLSDRNGVFAWGDVFEYLLNLLVTFNPLMFVPFIIYMWRQKATQEVGRYLRFISWGFMGFFLLSTARGYVQPQWVIPMAFAILYIITRAAERNKSFMKYTIKSGFVVMFLFVAVRIFAMTYSGDTIRLEIFGNKKTYTELAEQLDGRAMIFDGSYAQASKMNYYSDGFAYANPSIYNRSSHYQMLTLDDELYGKRVAVAVNTQLCDKLGEKGLDSAYRYFKISNSMGFYYDTVDFFIPVRKVDIDYQGLPDRNIINQPVVLKITMKNPYDYTIPLDKFRLIGQFKSGRFVWYEVDIPFSEELLELPAGDSVTFSPEIMIPKMDTGEYKFGLSLQRSPATSWYNSERKKITVTNPAQKRGL